MNQLLIYTPFISPKLSYVWSFVFVEQLSLTYETTDNQVDFIQSNHAYKLSYSPATDLEETPALRVIYSPYFKRYHNSHLPDFQKQLFPHQNNNTKFDLFAAIFYLLARVEEYGEMPRDNHDRYISENSILVKKKLQGSPLIDMWIKELAQKLQEQSDIYTISRPDYNCISTLDIDHFYAYRYKGIARQLGALGRDILKWRWGRVGDRLSPDPYDRIDDMLDWHEELGIELRIFVLTCEKRTAYDKSLTPKHPLFHDRVKALSESIELGIHPSYYSHLSPTQIQNEKALLEKALLKTQPNPNPNPNPNTTPSKNLSTKAIQSHTQKLNKNKKTNPNPNPNPRPITRSRQHYLRLRLPDTYAALIQAGIREDYSMGYADRIGFRAGTSLPFYWYDLVQDRPTRLKIIPFSVMDVTLKQYLRLSPEDAFQRVDHIIKTLREVNGTFSMIWHNSSFYEREGWQGYEAIYKRILSVAAPGADGKG